VLANCQALSMPALDSKLRQTDCADFTTMMSLLFSLPAWKRRQKRQLPGDQNTCNSGIYAITNIETQEQYIGSSNDISLRLNQHRGPCGEETIMHNISSKRGTNMGKMPSDSSYWRK